MRKALVAAVAAAFLDIHPAAAEVTPAAGYIYARTLLDDLTEGCVARGPGGTFVGTGPELTFPTPSGGTRSILFVSDGGAVRTVATGFNSVADCAYDAPYDTLYVLDSGAEFAGSTTGDTVFAIPGDAMATPADGHEVVPALSIPYAYSIAIQGEKLLVSDAAGGGLGTVVAIDLAGMTPVTSVFAAGFDYTGGLAVDGTSVFVAEALPAFDSAIYRYSAAGAYEATRSGPTYDHGSNDLALREDGALLATGSPTLAAVDAAGVATNLVTGINGGGAFDAFGGGVTVDAFTGRIDFTASTFSGADDDKSLHHLVPVPSLVVGGGAPETDCVMEFYGIELVPAAPGRPARAAICVDGEACDADGAADGGCTFPLGLCLNVTDPRLGGCAPTDVALVEARGALAEDASVMALVADAAALLPATDPTCVFGAGIRVPLRTTSGGDLKAGKATLRLRAVTADEMPRKDSDVARLVCEPAP